MLVLAAFAELGHLVNLPSQTEGVPPTASPPMLQLIISLLAVHCFAFLDNAGFSSFSYSVSLALFIPFSSFSASMYLILSHFPQGVGLFNHLSSSSLFSLSY